MSINKVMLSGNLTRMPELRRTQSGLPILNFGIAVNERRRNPQTEEWESRPNFFDCTLFGKRAEALAGILSKGMKVAIEGRLHWSQWDKDGQKRSKVDVTVDEVELMSARQAPGDGYGMAEAVNTPQSQDAYSAAGPAGSYDPSYDIANASFSVYDEDITF